MPGNIPESDFHGTPGNLPPDQQGGREFRAASKAIHPAPIEFTSEQLAVDPILRYFHYAHLPAKLQYASSPFCRLAQSIVEGLPRNAERTVALRKLLEAKDAAVRANVT